MFEASRSVLRVVPLVVCAALHGMHGRASITGLSTMYSDTMWEKHTQLGKQTGFTIFFFLLIGWGCVLV